MKVGIIDYGVGNLGSLAKALEQVGARPELLSHPGEMARVDRLVLPGVGNFTDCVRLLEGAGWPERLREIVANMRTPLLGICVGMQLLATGSTEGGATDIGNVTPGLGLIPGLVAHLRSIGCTLRVPHVGWNEVTPRRVGGHPLFNAIPAGTDFYFVHSYAFLADDPDCIVAQTDYGVAVAAAVARGRIWGTQFHPEKSSRAGLTLLRNFVEFEGC